MLVLVGGIVGQQPQALVALCFKHCHELLLLMLQPLCLRHLLAVTPADTMAMKATRLAQSMASILYSSVACKH
jgi:hypothetical protein